MTYGIAYSPIGAETRLRSLGFADSKTLTEAQRDAGFKAIKDNADFIGWIVTSLSPQDISRCMLGKNQYNLNAMSHDTAIALVHRVLELGVNLTELYVDTVGCAVPAKAEDGRAQRRACQVGIAEHYQAKLESIFPQLNIVVTSKARAARWLPAAPPGADGGRRPTPSFRLCRRRPSAPRYRVT